jgi:hypothetical protein
MTVSLFYSRLQNWFPLKLSVEIFTRIGEQGLLVHLTKHSIVLNSIQKIHYFNYNTEVSVINAALFIDV